MLDFDTAALVTTLLASIPLLVVGRVVWFAVISRSRFAVTDGRIVAHSQPRNEDGDPVQLQLKYRYTVGNQLYTGSRKQTCNSR